MPSIQNLPAELHLMIVKKLNLADRICLKNTNRYTYHSMTETRREDWPDLLEELNAEAKAQRCAPMFLRCRQCQRIRHTKRFADSTKAWHDQGEPWDGAEYWVAELQLSCIDCGIKNQSPGYRPGEVLVVMDTYYIVCTKCRRLKLMRSTKRPAVCSQCLEKARKLRGRERAKERAKERAEERATVEQVHVTGGQKKPQTATYEPNKAVARRQCG